MSVRCVPSENLDTERRISFASSAFRSRTRSFSPYGAPGTSSVPIFLFRSALHEPLSFYISLYARCLVPGIIAFVTLHFLLPLLPIDPSASFWLFLAYAVVTGLVAFAVYGGLLSIWEDGLKDFTSRILHVLRHR